MVQRASVPSFVILALLASGCASAQQATAATAAPELRERKPGRTASARELDGDPIRWIDEGEAALANNQPAKAATSFARYLSHAASPEPSSEPSSELGRELEPEGQRAYRGLARAHEQLGDFEAAIRAYDGFVAHFPDASELHRIIARRGACEAEIHQWERSANSYAQVLELGGEALLPSERVEALARRGFALFHLGEHAEADAVLAEADAIFEQATREGQERFSDTYFVGLARFYRAAIIHLEFRAVPIRLPEAQMSQDFERKLELLEQAQDRYNHVIRARHLYWVSAAGYQLGSLFEEFYDAVMHAPVPDWLDEQQRRIYYEELEEQLRPVLDKAVWVFEKNLETARKFGYEGEFIERTEAQLAQLQAIVLGRGEPGAPVPRLAPIEAREQLDPDQAIAFEELPAAERKLFVPMPTTL